MKIKIGLGIAVVVLLTACHENPLKTASKDKTARLLTQASKYAEEKAGRPQHARGYFDCIRGKQKALNCDQLYSDMVEYAQKEDDFENITVADLKNQEAFKRIKEYYEERLFWS